MTKLYKSLTNKQSQFWPKLTILTEIHKFDQISWNSRMLNKFYDLYPIPESQPISRITTQLQNFNQFPEFWPNFIMLTKFQNADIIHNTDNADNTDSTDNANNTDNTDNLYNTGNLYNRQCSFAILNRPNSRISTNLQNSDQIS